MKKKTVEIGDTDDAVKRMTKNNPSDLSKHFKKLRLQESDLELDKVMQSIETGYIEE